MTIFWSFTRPKLICERKLNQFFTLFIGTSLFLIVAFRSPDVLPDYNAYVNNFTIYKVYGYSEASKLSLEKSFFLISDITIRLFQSNIFFFFLIYAVFGFALKFIAINLLSDNINITLLVYLSFFYILHDFIQIRIGAAISFVLFSIYFKEQKKYLLCITLYAISIYFHYSCIFYIVIFFLKRNKINKWLYLFMICFSFIIPVFRIDFSNIFLLFDLGVYRDKIRVYSRYTPGISDDIINIPKMIRMIFAFIMIYKMKFLEKDHNNLLFIKLYFIAIIVQQLFYSIPAIPTRVSELFRVSEIFAIPKLRCCFKEKIIYDFIIIFYCISVFYFSFTSYII
jgi:hypothetical protein